MTRNAIKILLVSATAIVLTSCSQVIVGTWTVQKYETTSPGQQNVTLTNIGTMIFNKNNSGEKSLNYSVLGVTRDDRIPFTWKWDEGRFIFIEGENSEFAKTWIIMESKKKFQLWKSTDGKNNIQILELIK